MQELLNLNWQQDINDNEEFFVSSCNFDAYNTVMKHDWGRLIVIGDNRSGKTTLAKVWQKSRKGQFCRSLYDLNQKDDIDSIVVDDIESVNVYDLLSIVNYASEHSMQLLMLASEYPSFTLPDLKSRLSSTLKVMIKFPDIELAKKLIAKLFVDKQIKVFPEQVDYIVENIDREYDKMEYIVSYIDKMAETLGKKINLPTIRELMSNYCENNAGKF
jgi:chromosomal replication initiation ATPase DnaA